MMRYDDELLYDEVDKFYDDLDITNVSNHCT